MELEAQDTIVGMELMKDHDIFLSTCSGSLIHLKDNLNRKDNDIKRDKDRKTEITSLSWGRTDEELLIGNINGELISYDLISENYKNITNCKGKIVSVVPFGRDVIVATETGNVFQVSKNTLNSFIMNPEKGKTIRKAVLNPFDVNSMAVGGIENDLKIYDLTTKKATFQAKGDRHDELSLKQPISVSGISFLSSSAGHSTLATVTLQGSVRLYDTRAQRRPVKIYKHKESPAYTCISVTDSSDTIVVGTNKGCVQLYDVRGDVSPIKAIKTYMGAVVAVAGSPNYQEIVSCGMDRYLKVHSVQGLEPNYEEYLKIRVTNMIVRPKVTHESTSEEEEDELVDEEVQSDEDDEEPEEVPPKKRKTKT